MQPVNVEEVDWKKTESKTRWWQLKNLFIFTPNLGEMIQFDEHAFEVGWFNHQLEDESFFQRCTNIGVVKDWMFFDSYFNMGFCCFV